MSEIVEKPVLEVAYEKAVGETKAALLNLTNEEKDYADTHKIYIDTYNIWNTRKTIYCSGGSGGQAFELMGDYTDLTCANSYEERKQASDYSSAINQKVVELQGRVQSLEVSVPLKKKAYEDAKVAEAYAYSRWIEWRKANMSPEELSDYVNVGVAAQKEVSLLQSKQFYVIVGSILLLGTIAFILYKKYFSQ
jgi:hypothetical protein